MANLTCARLWERQGDLAAALRAARRHNRGGPIREEPFLSSLLREEGRLAALDGNRAEAVRAYRHYLALRANAEPALAADVAHVRAELARLLREDAGR